MKALSRFFEILHYYGVTGLCSFFMEVYWQQDLNGVNEGRDICTFKHNKKAYNRAKFQDRYEGFITQK